MYQHYVHKVLMAMARQYHIAGPTILLSILHTSATHAPIKRMDTGVKQPLLIKWVDVSQGDNKAVPL